MQPANQATPELPGADIFLSYAREDSAIAERLVAALLADGFTVWWDRDRYSGQPFGNDIGMALKNAKCTIVLWSKHSVDSHWVMREATHAMGFDMLIPARIGPTALGFPFDSLRTINLVGWSGEQTDLDYVSLKRAIVEKVGRPKAVADSVVHRCNPLTRLVRRISLTFNNPNLL
jgi:adenylate cyclase